MTGMDIELATNLITRVNIGDSLTRTAGRFPDHPAVVDGDRRWTYAELNARVNRVAHGLAQLGYERGDALALASGNSCEFLVTYYACAKLGVVCVPMNLGWRADEIAYVLDHSESKGIVVEAQLVALVQPAVEKVPAIRDVIVAYGTDGQYEQDLPDRHWCTFKDIHANEDGEPECFVADRDAISYLYTSGTTSFPKGVVGSHTAIYLESLMAAAETQITHDDRVVCLMPLFHTAQLNGFGTPVVMMGGTQYLMRGFDPDQLLDLIEREHITRAFALPMMWRALVERPDIGERELSSLAVRRVRDGTHAGRAAAQVHRHDLPELLPRLRPDRDEPGDDVLPARAPTESLRRGRHPGGQRPDRDHGRRRQSCCRAARRARSSIAARRRSTGT